MNIWAIFAATLAAFVASSIYYAMFAKQRAKLSAKDVAVKPSPWQVVVELGRNVVIAFVLAYIIGLNDSDNTIVLSILLWAGFPVVLLVGSVMYEKTSATLAAIHAGDWLIKLFLMTANKSI